MKKGDSVTVVDCRATALVFGLLSLVAVVLMSIAIALIEDRGVIAIAAFIAAAFAAIAGLGVLYGGRWRYTRTAILMVPWVGRVRWVDLREVELIRWGEQLELFTDGKWHRAQRTPPGTADKQKAATLAVARLLHDQFDLSDVVDPPQTSPLGKLETLRVLLRLAGLSLIPCLIVGAVYGWALTHPDVIPLIIKLVTFSTFIFFPAFAVIIWWSRISDRRDPNSPRRIRLNRRFHGDRTLLSPPAQIVAR